MKTILRLTTVLLFWSCALPSFGKASTEQIETMLSAWQVDAAAELLATPELTAEPSMRNARLRVALIRQDYKLAEPLVN